MTLDLVRAHTFDDSIPLLEYVPTLLDRTPGD